MEGGFNVKKFVAYNPSLGETECSMMYIYTHIELRSSSVNPAISRPSKSSERQYIRVGMCTIIVLKICPHRTFASY
jgi:hypothetical protein